jgi:hypothetical protein
MNTLDVFYYFCSYLTDSLDSCSTLLRSLASQIIQKHQDLAIFVYNVYIELHPKSTKKALVELLPKLLQAVGSTRLVFDGLDEWGGREQKELLDCLAGIISTDRGLYICKVLISSRDTLEISRSLTKKFKTSVLSSLSSGHESTKVNESIAHFVDAKLSQMPSHLDSLDPQGSILADIKQKLLEKSNGNYL